MSDFNKIEEKILEFWEKNEVFEKGQERRKNRKPFVFFEGPPTANGQPGIHHFIGRAFKDLFNRYKTMRGFYVERHGGWDTHGLPVEIEVEKDLGLKSKKEIEDYGIAKFNHRAKQSVWKYKDEWERFTKRIGFWLDLKHPYITYEPKYIESLWWIIKQFWDKKLLFRGHKVVPLCTRCGTPLSSHEVAQGYHSITDKSVIVKFQITNNKLRTPKDKPAGQANSLPSGDIYDKSQILKSSKLYILAWTTTPWTLPGNVALAVGERIDYVVLERGGEYYILAKDLVEKVFSKNKISQSESPQGLKTKQVDYRITKELKGADLVGLKYQPLFDIPVLQTETSYKIYPADFVTTEDGTGVVHTAVMYGEDDYNLGLKTGLPQYHTVDEKGLFTKDVKEFEGRYVKEAEKDIVIYLKNKGLLFAEKEYEHDYPFCWRCEQPLLYYAMNSWFVGVSKLEKQLCGNNEKINWQPAHLKEGRFGEWLRGVKDWAFSRDRYWGTPLPIWRCRQGHHRVIGSFEELEKFRLRKKNAYYLMRHGFSVKNIDGLVNSRLESDHYPLTPKGVKEVKKEAAKLKRLGVDLIYSAPFLRTKETAELVSQVTGARVLIDGRLGEIKHASVCEDKHCVCLPTLATNPQNLDFVYGDGESWSRVRHRIFEVLKEIDSRYEGKKILIVSHGDPLTLLMSVMQGWDNDKLLEVLTAGGENKARAYPRKGKFYRAELKNRPRDENGQLDPHRPYIDDVILRCTECGGRMQRIKEVADAWFDSGAMPFAQWHYPFENRARFAKNFPADFVAEGVDQTRGWFYTLLAVSTLLGRGAPYKNVISYGHVLDAKGQKMSKSRGNVINPRDVIDKFGAEATRWYFYGVNHPGEQKLFSLEEVAMRRRGFVGTMENVLRFFSLYHRPEFSYPRTAKPVNNLDRWLWRRFQETLKTVSETVDAYDPSAAVRAMEQLAVEDFSKWWLRRSRPRFQRPASEKSLRQDLSFLKFFLGELAKLIAPFTPFLAEHIYQELHLSVGEPKSVHWCDWPKIKKRILAGQADKKLAKDMELTRRLVALGLAIRQKEKIKVRQPLAELIVFSSHLLGPELADLIKDELNVKEIVWARHWEGETLGHFVFEDEDGLKVGLNIKTDKALKHEGWAREIVRQLQDLRKEAGYKFSDKVGGQWHSEDKEVKEATGHWSEFIAQNSLLKHWAETPHGERKALDAEKEFALEEGRKIWLGVKK